MLELLFHLLLLLIRPGGEIVTVCRGNVGGKEGVVWDRGKVGFVRCDCFLVFRSAPTHCVTERLWKVDGR